ncbi:MAG: hypothetical protein SOV59_08375 [Fusobacterium mortiferum]|nr:hypothetical protein [Fusobacterium mortiferum]
MRKLIVLSVVLGLLTACGGEKVNTTSKAYKKELLSKIYEKNDKEAKAEYHKIIAELESIESGEANDEIERWEDLKADYEAKALQRMSEQSRAVAEKFKSKKGNGW